MDSYEGSSASPLSFHKYLYGNGDGINNTDPSGNFTLTQVIVAVAVLTVLLAVSALVYFKFAKRPINVKWKWENSWKSPDNGADLDAAEQLSVKQTAYEILKKAYSGFVMNQVEDQAAEREIIVSKLFGDPSVGSDGEMGSTNPNIKSSTVYYPHVIYAMNQNLARNGLSKTRSELIQGLGRGIGATASHELGHQIGYEFVTHTSAPGYYDSKGTGDVAGLPHFFDELKWTNSAIEKMNGILMKSE